uniref:Uncharacterized protein n=1 Tax=Aegilops tauschii subsp. strangulata TaxID=200361 RepID=A0A453C010_AEGTS
DGRGAGGYMDSYESMYSPGGGLRSLTGTPASSTRLSFEPHPLVGDAWDALRRSLVCFRGQPLGTIAAVDSSSGEVLNYDQGVREGFRAERAGVPDERRAGNREELPAEDAAAAGVGEEDRPVQAGRGRHAGELQGAQGPEARSGHPGGGLRRERHRPRGAGRLRVLVDHPAPRLHQVHRRPHAGRDARVPEGHPPHHEPVPRRGLRHLPHPPLRRRLLHDRSPDGRVRVPDRDPSPLLHVAAVRAAAAEAGGGGEQGHHGADRDAAARAELPHADLLLARLPAAQRHLPLQDGGVLPHGRQQVQRHPGVHPGLALRLHALPRRLLRRQRQPRQDGLPLVRAGELRRHPRLARHARAGRRHHGPHRGAVGGPHRRDAAQDLLPRHRGPRVAERHRLRPQEHQVELPQRRLLACADLAPDGGLHQDRAAQDREAGDRPGGGEAGEGQLAGVLRRQARPVRREAGEKAPDVVHRGVPGGQDDAGGPVPPGHDLPRGGQGHEPCAQEVCLMDCVR